MLTPELEAEGMARDLINRIQRVRKDLDWRLRTGLSYRFNKTRR